MMGCELVCNPLGLHLSVKLSYRRGRPRSHVISHVWNFYVARPNKAIELKNFNAYNNRGVMKQYAG